MNLLIVDDNKHFRTAFKFTLQENFGSEIKNIWEAENGVECLQIMERENVDTVFMDLEMPLLDGVETTRQITELYRGVIVIAVSFHSEMQEVQKMIQAGARNYVIKEEISKEVLSECLKIK